VTSQMQPHSMPFPRILPRLHGSEQVILSKGLVSTVSGQVQSPYACLLLLAECPQEGSALEMHGN
jgi:hypothetical protein